MKTPVYLVYLVLFCLLLVGGTFTGEVRATTVSKLFVIPELKTWKKGNGSFTPGEEIRICCPAGDARIRVIAEQWAADYKILFGRPPAIAAAKAACSTAGLRG